MDGYSGQRLPEAKTQPQRDTKMMPNIMPEPVTLTMRVGILEDRISQNPFPGNKPIQKFGFWK